jgi:hypothetical protein
MRDDEQRIAANEDAFRKQNEMLRLGQGSGGPMFLLCECGAPDCKSPIRMGLEDYERLRSHGRRFVVVRDHVVPEVERVVESHHGYDVVEKLHDAGEEAVRRGRS